MPTAKRRKKEHIKSYYDEVEALVLMDLIKPRYGHRLADRSMSIEDALHEFFQADYREIYFVRFDADFHVYGDIWITPYKKHAKWGNRQITAGTTGLIRLDVTDKDRIDIQLRLVEEDDVIFTLTRGQWQAIKRNVTVIYKSNLTGIDPTKARKLKIYHEKFVKQFLGCGFEYYTASDKLRPDYKKTGS